MYRRIGWMSVALSLFICACANVWQFKDFQAESGDDAEVDGTVRDSAKSDVEVEAGDDALMDADSQANDVVTPPVDSGVTDGPGDQGAEASCADPCPTGEVCDNGVCGCPDPLNLCGTMCVDFMTDPAHCGSCQGACPSGASCVQSVCACPPAQPSACSGACVDTKSDHANCGGCGAPCVAGSACHNGACTACGAIATGKVCSTICVDVSTDVKNCGDCGHRCASGASCVAGVCACPPGEPTTCAVALADAGSCVNTTIDDTNCGGCGNVCKLAHANVGCGSSSCTLLSCFAGYGDCDKTVTNGCETHTAADPNNCNACGAACTLPHATAGCAASTCTVAACLAGFGNCDAIAANGCEVNTRNDANNCGACSMTGASHACTGGKVCQSSTCVCPAGSHDCSGTCVSDTSTSISSCGVTCMACAAPTNGTATCSGAPPECGGSCGKAQFPTLCGNACINTMKNNNNCGGCGPAFACASGSTCVAGVCTAAMDAGGSDAAGSDAATGDDQANGE